MSWLNSELDGDYEEYADYKPRTRPNPKANRPRTKRRPDHEDAVPGMVYAVDRGRYSVVLDGVDSTRVIASRARELHKTAIVIGDRVDLVGDTSGAEGTLARIVRIAERDTVLRRSADDTDRFERIMVANATQMLIVIAAADPEPRIRLVDRYLVAAYDAGISPLLCVTKTDLQDPEEFLEHFAALDIPVFALSNRDYRLAPLREALEGEVTVFVGHSGVGKSTLINELIPDADRETGDVNEVTGRGRHTSSSSHAYLLDESDPRSGWVIDTPGVRSFGLGHVTAESILMGFTELYEIAQSCPRGCAHDSNAPDCALDEDAAESQRVESFRRLLGAK